MMRNFLYLDRMPVPDPGNGNDPPKPPSGGGGG